MKNSESDLTHPIPAEALLLWRQVLAILVAATVLGLLYNQASPLGVRASVPAAMADTNKPAESVPKRMGFVNETLSLTLEASDQTPAPGTAPNRAAPPAPPPAVAPAQALDIPDITWVGVKPLLAAGKIVLVDARPKSAYDVGHIPGAVSLSSNSQAADVQVFARAYPPNTAFVAYCGSESCHASRQILDALVRLGGFTHVSDMRGGYAEFLATQAPATPPPPAKP